MALILVFVRKLTGRIGGYFMAQQRALADLNGYVEEMVNGQKVVKVFCHEEQSKEELHRPQPRLGRKRCTRQRAWPTA